MISPTKSLIRGRKLLKKIKDSFDREGRRLREDFSGLRNRYFKHYWEKVAHDIHADIEDLGYGFHRISTNDRFVYVNHYKVSLDDHLSLNLAMIKPVMHRLLKDAGFRVPKYLEYDVADLSKAYDFLKSLPNKAVVKPVRGWAGNGVVTGVCDFTSLKKASFSATMYDSRIFMEEEIAGDSFRLLYLDGVLIDAVRRERPAIVGDGRSNIRELIKQENDKRLNGAQVTALSPITIDEDCLSRLREQDMKINDVPAADSRLVLKNVVNQNGASENHVVRDQVHSSFNDMGRRLKSILDLKLIGLDIMASTLEVPLEESGGVINEVNGTPGLHHHDLVAETDEKCQVGEKILKFMLA